MTLSLRLCLGALLLASFPLHAANEKSEQLPRDEAQGQSLLSAQLSSDSEQLKVTFTTEDTPTVWTHVYLQTDSREDTGHRHWSSVEGRSGFDFMVEGEALYSWAGKDDQRGWHWERVASATVTRLVNGNEVTIGIPWSELGVKGGKAVLVFLETMNENFQTALDVLPREGALLSIDVPAGVVSLGPDGGSKVALVPPAADARPRFKKIQTYACYYGKGQIEALSGRGAAIIEAKNQSAESVAAIKKNGTLTIGYISAGEDGELRKGDEKGPGGYDSAYYDRNGDNQPDKNEIWSSYFTRAASESWVNYFLGQAKKLREQYGVDGFFLDTVETFTLYTDNRKPMVELVRRLREEYPDAIIVLNRGWDLLPDLAGTVDGMMYESFTLSYDFASKSYVRMRPSALDEGLMISERFIKPAQEKHGLVVLALDYAGGPDEPGIQDSFDRAVSFGMIPEVSNIYLDQIYPHKFTGHKSEEWLKNFLTPENMSYRTTNPANGFPSGTRILPSSLYPDYEVSPVVDGVKEKKALGWRNRAWASIERPDPHWLEFELPEPTPVSQVRVVWATDNGEAFPSKKFSVEVQPKNDSKWETVWKTDSNLSKDSVVTFAKRDVQKIRVVQEPEGGSSARPNLMWVEQVEIAQ